MTIAELAAELDALRERAEWVGLTPEEHERMTLLQRLFREADTVPEIPAAKSDEEGGADGR